MAHNAEDFVDEVGRRLCILEARAAPAECDQFGRTAMEARQDYLEFARRHPTFERGKSRWADFAGQFGRAVIQHAVTQAQAKEILYDAIVGTSSRLVVASMQPDRAEMDALTFEQYLQRIGEKFTTAAESLQMEAEYKARTQGKQEDVQNYINAKYELFQLARPQAQDRDQEEFYRECTEGFINKYVRDQLFAYEPTNVEAFGGRAVVIVQIERRRIRIGDSDTSNLDGLIPVTKPVRESDRGRKEEAMEVDHASGSRGRSETCESESEDECECMALQEHGFRGPCFYCQKQGHMVRTCPRKSAGLPKFYRSGNGGGDQSEKKW